MIYNHHLKFHAPRSSRRKGQAIVYMALVVPALVGAAAMSVDMGRLYYRHTQEQHAADAAALAAAWCNAYSANCVTSNGTPDTPVNRGNTYASLNGFGSSSQITVAQTTPWPAVNPNPNWYNVTITSQEPLFFASIFGMHSEPIVASATALWEGYQPVPLSPAQFGLGSSAIYNYSMFGPYSYYSYGDYTDSKYYDFTQGALANQVNPGYNPAGTSIFINVPAAATYIANQQAIDTELSKLGKPAPKVAPTSKVAVQLFDPTTTDHGLDEIRAPNTSAANTGYDGNEYTVTQYSLYFDVDGNPLNPNASDHQLLGQATYGGGDTTANEVAEMTWVTPGVTTGDPGNATGSFEFDRANYVGGNFHLQVQALNGASENGYTVRVGPYDTSVSGPGNSTTADDQTWMQDYGEGPVDANGNMLTSGSGASVGADGVLPVNLNVNGTAVIDLGPVSPNNPLPAGSTNAGTITVQKYDTDVGAESINYEMHNNDGTITPYTTNYTFQGSHILLDNTNGGFSTDTIVLPTTFTGGTLYVDYQAGSSDTSEWAMSYSGDATPGTVKLIQ